MKPRFLCLFNKKVSEAEARGEGPTGADNYADGGGGHILSLQRPRHGLKYPRDF